MLSVANDLGHRGAAHSQIRPLVQPVGGRSRLTALYQSDPLRYPYLLASTAEGANSRFDILLAHPQQSLVLTTQDLRSGAAGFLDRLHDGWLQERIDAGASPAGGMPFTGGWFVYLSYELAEEIEPVLDLPMGDPAETVAMAVRCPAAVIYDHRNDRHIAVAEPAHSHRLDAIERDFNRAIENDSGTATDSEPVKLDAMSEAEPAPYLDQIARIKQYIVDGDIFQANLSRPWRLKIDETIGDVAIFDRLARTNPGSFAVLAALPGFTVISSSPERLVSVRQGRIETRPIAGTRPRSDNESMDNRLACELMAHPKEQAEHIMLIDLERNDLGRICVPGSIEVNELMTLETYRHVHHIVSNIRGSLREEVSPADVIRAVFPGGTITGCPKVRCMEILAEMEQQPRGAYTGTIGYINRDGSMDLNILIRTLVRRGDTLTFRAGGGIVADSDAERELEETRAKAKGLLRVFGVG